MRASLEQRLTPRSLAEDCYSQFLPRREQFSKHVEIMSDPKQALRQALRDIADKFAVDVTSQPLVPGQDYLPCCGKLVGAGEFGALLQASADMWLTAGRFADEFEATFPTVWGMKRSLLVNSGSSANLVSLAALMSPKLRERALKPGDEFITTACAFPTTVAPAIQYGLKPIFIDVHETTHNATPEMIEAAITPKTRLVMIAHSLGNPFRADRVARSARATASGSSRTAAMPSAQRSAARMSATLARLLPARSTPRIT